MTLTYTIEITSIDVTSEAGPGISPPWFFYQRSGVGGSGPDPDPPIFDTAIAPHLSSAWDFIDVAATLDAAPWPVLADTNHSDIWVSYIAPADVPLSDGSHTLIVTFTATVWTYPPGADPVESDASGTAEIVFTVTSVESGAVGDLTTGALRSGVVRR